MAFALFILYVLLTYIHPGQIVPELGPYRITYWVGIAGLVVSIAALAQRRDGPGASLQLWLVSGFTVVTMVSLLVAERWLAAPIVTLQRFGPSLTTFVLVVASVTSMLRFRIAVGCIVALTMIVGVQGVAAYHLGYNAELFLLDRTAGDDDAADGVEDPVDSWSIDQQTFDLAPEDERRTGVRIRALGFMNDPNDLALGLIVGLGLIGGAWRRQLNARNLLLAAAAAAFIYGIYLTRSRGGMVALVVVLWRIAANRAGPIPALVLLVALGAGAMALDFDGRELSTALDESASGRVEAWKEGLEMLKQQPLLGVGYGQFLDHHTLTAHNSLVLCFAETGLLGAFFWIGLFVVTVIELRGLKALPGDDRSDRLLRHCAEGLHLALIGFIAAASFLSRTFVPTLYLIIGLSTALAAIARGAGKSVRLPALPDLGMLVLASEAVGIGIVYTMVRLYAA